MGVVMANDSSPPTTVSRSQGRGYFWAGIGLCALAIALCAVQYAVLKKLIVPWYLPALTTVGVLLLIVAVGRRRGILRIATLGLVAALAAFQWYFVASLAKLPDYTGPARAGQPIPPFTTKLADGRSFTQQDLQDGTPSALVFFRGRW
jgi:hypothetical protein